MKWRVRLDLLTCPGGAWVELCQGTHKRRNLTLILLIPLLHPSFLLTAAPQRTGQLPLTVRDLGQDCMAGPWCVFLSICVGGWVGVSECEYLFLSVFKWQVTTQLLYLIESVSNNLSQANHS